MALYRARASSLRQHRASGGTTVSHFLYRCAWPLSIAWRIGLAAGEIAGRSNS